MGLGKNKHRYQERLLMTHHHLSVTLNLRDKLSCLYWWTHSSAVQPVGKLFTFHMATILLWRNFSSNQFFFFFLVSVLRQAKTSSPHFGVTSSSTVYAAFSLTPLSHFVSVSGSLRDRRGRQSYKVKYLGLALALQVSVIILLKAFLLCWIIMEVRVYACHHSRVGGGSQRALQAGKCLLPCYVITITANLFCCRWNWFSCAQHFESPPASGR